MENHLNKWILVVIRWSPLASVLIFLLMGVTLGFFYEHECVEGKKWALNVISQFSESDKFNFFCTLAILWLFVSVAVCGRSSWPVNKTRAVAMYFPIAFSFGFAARFFSLLFGFVGMQPNNPEAVTLGYASFLTFLFVCSLVAFPTYFSFRGKLTDNETAFRLFCGVGAIPLACYIWYMYA